ncbi:MAG: hypothetical protein ACFWTJ_15565 [Lachnoclostridium sp.]|jgi:small acid-soluble spore protein H (minor)
MNRKRAREIISSNETAHVTFNGRPVSIETLHPTKDTASVHYLDQPWNSQEVSLTQLVESE